ncbi:MAG: ABC transporter substrate-binding protein, partial [Pseudomonadota bacterium]
DVGYLRALSPEGLLSMEPDLVLAEADSGPPEAIDVLRSARIEFVTVPDSFDAGAVREKIETIAAALGMTEEGEALAARLDREIAEAMAEARRDNPPRMMFILSMAGGRIMAAGSDTAAQGIIELAGGVNAVEGYEGYKPLSDEAAIGSMADVVIMMDRGGNHAADDSELWNHPGLAATPAAESGAVVRIDGLLLLGFGPRLPLAIRTLTAAVNDAIGAP